LSNVAVTHAPSGLLRAEVIRTERISPHLVRVTFGGGTLEQFEFQGFDQWFRLAVPTHVDDRFDNLPERYGVGGFLKYLTLAKGTRPVIRNYTARDFRPESHELDVDFVVHGAEGIAGPWSTTVQPGTQVALIDQGRGWRDTTADQVVLVGDESGLPAVAGILRDLPRDTRGQAIIELFDAADRQEVSAPGGVEVHWVVREAGAPPGTAALPALADLDLDDAPVAGFVVGESSLATGGRRHLVAERGVAKRDVIFCGYWRR
jgi:NADPH-dependent ferric siderophore reductase